MKKLVFMVLAVFAVVSVQAVEWSIGGTLGGFGPSFTRGNDAAALNAKGKYAFSPVIAFAAQVDFIPYFGLEVNAGYGTKYITLQGGEAHSALAQIQVPLYLRAQYEFANFANLYVLAGPKFLCNVGTYDGYSLKQLDTENYNPFDLDISLALGTEFRIAKSHRIGLRATYDINVLGSYKNTNLYTDDLVFSLTYRYVF